MNNWKYHLEFFVKIWMSVLKTFEVLYPKSSETMLCQLLAVHNFSLNIKCKISPHMTSTTSHACNKLQWSSRFVASQFCMLLYCMHTACISCAFLNALNCIYYIALPMSGWWDVIKPRTSTNTPWEGFWLSPAEYPCLLQNHIH